MTGGAELARLRGAVPAKRHNARTIAALTGNPGCTRRAVLDAAGVDKPRLAQRIGFPSSFGQSRFALARGNGFEAMLKADGCALLLALLRDTVGLEAPDVGYDDLGSDADDTLAARQARTRELLAGAAGAALIDHPLLTLDVAGQQVFLEPDLIALQVRGRLHVVEIKSFAVVDGQADGAKVSGAAVQAAVYVLALRRLLAELGHDETLVSHDVVLVCPENFSLRPTAVVLDVRKQLATLRRQLTRLASVSGLIAALPPSVRFDLALPPAELIAALDQVAARYAPECLSTCELSVFCRHESAGTTATLGRPVRDALGGIETIDEVLAFAAGTGEPAAEQAEAAALLRTAARLRAEALTR
ncbi:hypothetical protein [Jidongwangia harbinensis]|uniref:hypothetical protein n=1 Tax=Jidongwangia harbinensis TaxID=2878561 RepID=UPI001CD9E982|nr:hypothetical protein [Jidongwangia harbinensis]MCA2215368.1 hypothetical protein [Jidongwangia harbinensis]